MRGGRGLRRRARWVRWPLMIAGIGIMMLGGLIWRSRSLSEPPRMSDPYPVAERPAVPAGRTLLVVEGNPGWDELTRDERDRGRRSLSADARRWLVDHRMAVRNVAGAFGVDPVALGGIVAAEKTLLVGRVDALGEDLFRGVFGSMREEDLARWAADQEEVFQRRARAGEVPERGTLRAPYLWTLGPAQVSFRLAVRTEPLVAARLGRPQRSVRQIVAALTTMPGNLEYAGALVAEAERAYLEIAGMDIAGNPGLLATLYHLGAPRVRARRLAAENARRIADSAPLEPPRVNFYGGFVNRHAAEIAELLIDPPSDG